MGIAIGNAIVYNLGIGNKKIGGAAIGSKIIFRSTLSWTPDPIYVSWDVGSITITFSQNVFLSTILNEDMTLNESSEVTYEDSGKVLILDYPENNGAENVIYVVEVEKQDLSYQKSITITQGTY